MLKHIPSKSVVYRLCLSLFAIYFLWKPAKVCHSPDMQMKESWGYMWAEGCNSVFDVRNVLFPRVLMGKTTAEWYWQYRIRIMIHDIYIYNNTNNNNHSKNDSNSNNTSNSKHMYCICLKYIYIYIYVYTANVWHVWHTVHIIWYWPSQCQAKNCNGNAGDGGKVMATRVSRYTLW